MSVEATLGLLPDALVLALRAAAPAELRRFAAACAALAVSETRLDEPGAIEGLSLARLLAAGTDPEDARMSVARAALREDVRRLDDVQFTVREQAEAEQRFETPEAQAEYETAFNRARAANAVLNALHTDPLSAAAETAYEVIAGIGLPEGRVLPCLGIPL